MAKEATQEERDIAIKAYQGGASLKEAATLVGRSKIWVSNTLRRAGLAPRKPNRPMIDQGEVKRLYKTGLSQKKVADLVGCSNTYVRSILTNNGVELRACRAPVSDNPHTRYCTDCVEEKPLSAFRKNAKKRKGVASVCRGCSAHRLRRYKYGIGAREFDKMVRAQNNKCKICETEMKRGMGGMAVDHCHTLGAVRGLLCGNCNKAIGLMQDSPARLRAAARYLDQPSIFEVAS